MIKTWAALLLLAATAQHAHADGAAVDVADLPPLPDADEEQSSSATVLAATAAEEDIVVGAAKREQSLGNVASAVTVISADRIRRFGYRTVGEAVAGVAGTFIEDTRIVTTLGIRGLSLLGDFNTRILILIDGATVNEAWGSFAPIGFGSLVSIDEIARIEVIRGPVSSVYGTNAFFGIINIVTRGAAETPRAWARASVNSVNGVTTTAGFASGGVHQQIRGTASVMDRFGDTTSIDGIGKELQGDASQAYNASIVGSYGGSFAQVRAYRFRRDSPWAPYNGDPGVASPYSEYNTQLLVEGGHTREVNDRLTVAGRAYGNFYRFYDHIVQYQAPNFDDYGDARTVGAELRGRYQIVPNNKLGITGGTEANYNSTRSRSFEYGSMGVEVKKPINIEGVYTELDGQPLPWLGFTGGVRYDRNSVIDTRVSPRAALFLAKPEKYGLKLLYAEGFRNPSAFEAFFHDDVSFTKPVNLTSETIRSFEGVLWAKPLPGLATRISGYYWDARKIVEQQLITDPTFGDILQFQNIGRFITEGIEVEGSYRDSRGWYAFGGGCYSRVGRSNGVGPIAYGNVENAPTWTASGGLSTPKLFDVAHVSGQATFIGTRPSRPDADGNPLPGSPGWLGLDATVYVPNVSGFDITAGVKNILGTRDLMPAPGDYDRTVPTTLTIGRIPGEGREVYVKVGYSY